MKNESLCLCMLALLISGGRDHRLLAVESKLARGRKSDYERGAKLRQMTKNRVFHDSIEPHWAGDGKSMWYRVRVGQGRSEYVHVDIEKGVRHFAFDHERLAAALKEAGRDVNAKNLPVRAMHFGANREFVEVRLGAE